MAIFLEMVDDSTAGNSFYKSQDVFRVYLAVRNQVKMVEHYYVGKYEKLPGKTGLVQRAAHDLRERIGAKDRQAILRDCC